MSRARSIITVASGRRAKWAVVVFWLIIVAVAGPLSGKLTGAEKNDSSAWLPAKAESTKVLDLQSQFQSPNIFTAVVVYDRPSGLTSADRAKAVADAKQFAQQPGVVPGQVTGPIFAQDGKAIETLVPVNLGSKGWNGASAAVTSLPGWLRTSPARWAAPRTRPTRSRASTAPCCSPPWSW
jgi:putative drug exporter of the RND superfamily